MNIKKLNENAIVPTRGLQYSAGFDLYALTGTETKSKRVYPGAVQKVGTGIAVEIPEGYFGAIFARSELSTKQGLRPANCVGVIDSDYRGEVIVPLYNDSGEWRTVQDGDRIAQLVIIPYAVVELNVVDELEKTDRNTGGFGSTGI